MDRLLPILKRIFIIGVIIYAFLTMVYIINIPQGTGDEQLFINDLELIKNNGWIAAIKKSISIPFMILVYPLTFIVKNYIALRLVSLCLVIGLCVYFWKRNKPSLSFFATFLFYLSSTIFFFYGTNDALFSVLLIVFFNEIFQLYENHSFKSSTAFIAITLAFFTRVLTFVYLPIILLAFFIIYKHRKKVKLKFSLPLLFISVMLVINIPSLNENGSLSYDFKEPPKSVNVTWIQRQYLAQMLVDKGDLKKGQHPTWQETQHYVDINGAESLPKGIGQSVFFDISVTIKEFFKDLFFASVSSFRQLGFIFVLIIILPFIKLIKNKKIEYNMFIPVSFLIMLCVFSLIIISNVELRWLAPVFVMSLVWYFNLEKNKGLSNKLVITNYLIFIALVGYGSLRIFDKIV